MPLTRKSAVVLAKAAVAAVLIVAVCRQFARLLDDPAVWDAVQGARAEYLLPAGLLYLAAHTLWGAYWVRLLRSQGAAVTWRAGLRAYFVSQFGKYVPGKAWVLVLRVLLLRGTPGATPLVVAATATYETLTSMGAGALIGLALASWAGPRLGISWDSPRGLAVLAVGLLPVLLGLAARVVKRLPAPPLGLMLQGLAQDAAGWLCLGLSLGLTVRGLTGDAVPLTADTYLQDLAAVSLSYVAGFVVLVSPGGLGAREFVLQQVLAPQLEPTAGSAAGGVAALVALVLRLVWTAFEVAAALLLLADRRPTSCDRERAVDSPSATAPSRSRLVEPSDG